MSEVSETAQFCPKGVAMVTQGMLFDEYSNLEGDGAWHWLSGMTHTIS